MPAMHVSASIDIARPIEDIRQALTDFTTWPVWSPWLYAEPDAELTFQGEAHTRGHGYTWKGEKTGAGEMTLTQFSDTRIDCDLHFIKPFKSQADVAFDLKVVEGAGIRVTWYMDSKLPFFMFPFKNMMSAMIRSDYERGLRMLKDYVESGAIPSRFSLDGIVNTEAASYVAHRGSSSMGTLSEAMGQSYGQVFKACEAESLPIAGPPFCVYHKVDVKNDRFDYAAAVPVAEHVNPTAPVFFAVRPAAKTLKVTHTGAYRHLGNAWAVLMGEARHRKLKPGKQQHPFEIYLNDPDDTAEADLVTELYLPLRK